MPWFRSLLPLLLPTCASAQMQPPSGGLSKEQLDQLGKLGSSVEQIGQLGQLGSWWSPPWSSDSTLAAPGSPEAKCNMYPSCVAVLTNQTFPQDGFCCPAGNGERMDCCVGGFAVEPNVTQYNASTAVCVIDVMQAAFMLSRAGSSLNAAYLACTNMTQNPTGAQAARCAAPVTSVISSFIYSAQFLSMAAAECAESLHIKELMESQLNWSADSLRSKGQAMQLQAECAGAVSGFVAGLAQIAESGPLIQETCEWNSSAVDDGTVVQENVVQASSGSASFLGWTRMEIQQQREAECALDIGQAVMFLAQAGTQINTAVNDCSDDKIKIGGKHAKAMCSVNVAGIIRSFGFVASMLSFSVANCPIFEIDLNAACSGAIATMITGIAGIAAAGSAFRDTCEFISNATKAVFGM